MSAEARVKELNLELPSAGRALGVYKPIVVVGTGLSVGPRSDRARTARRFAVGSARISIARPATKPPGKPL